MHSDSQGRVASSTPSLRVAAAIAAEETMARAGLLKRARAEAGIKRGRPVTQEEAAEVLGWCRKTYAKFERGAHRELTLDKVEALADLLMVDEVDRNALFLYTLGYIPGGPRSELPSGDTHRDLQLLLDDLNPKPCYMTDGAWNIIGYNAAMAQWFPWVERPGANLITWALLDPEAQDQMVNWEHHARIYVGLVRAALTECPDDPEVCALWEHMMANPKIHDMWHAEDRVVDYRDGDHWRLHIKRFDHEDLDVEVTVLLPAKMQHIRVVVIRWLAEETADLPDELAHDHRDTPLHLVQPASSDLVTTNSLGEIQAFALAHQCHSLPNLSAQVGPRADLRLDCGQGREDGRPVVMWSTRQSNGSYKVQPVDLRIALRRLCPADPNSPAAAEYLTILAALLPDDREQAVERLGELVEETQARSAMYERMLASLAS
ncbi:helix-turn-helix transcriptional regulator [Streptacidiphilus jiangxiensis]|uniref:Helix-turn-helix domain-containing protein n=1 Tax=Streptacidiphilus jiangxiensis TaxID=235985 RepID=A0A1H7H1I8_STRJI|nr:helix-turn-helix transcriptional regulator [Streptacidiphilus jiangxiensis]SEK44283.1 Helix-turn-helix domain-containing protein [Streptacidiphilus jiangxiensis]